MNHILSFIIEIPDSNLVNDAAIASTEIVQSIAMCAAKKLQSDSGWASRHDQVSESTVCSNGIFEIN